MSNRKEAERRLPRSSLQSAVRWFISFAFQMNLEGSGVGAESMTQKGVRGGVSSAAYEQPCPAASAGPRQPPEILPIILPRVLAVLVMEMRKCSGSSQERGRLGDGGWGGGVDAERLDLKSFFISFIFTSSSQCGLTCSFIWCVRGRFREPCVALTLPISSLME